jgi:gliding motility-associated-like protein
MGCIDSVFLTDYICVNSNPIADFSANTYDPTILDNSVSFINESFNATNYQWDFADGSFSFQEDVTHDFPSNHPGEYFVILYAYNESNCVDSIGKMVKVWDKLFFYVPNTFTPDNDELNQVFMPLFGSGYSFDDYEFSIFNRWGERIFETSDIYKGWDGMYRGDLSQDGTYTWKIILRASEDAMEDEQKNIYYGHVNLIR